MGGGGVNGGENDECFALRVKKFEKWRTNKAKMERFFIKRRMPNPEGLWRTEGDMTL